MENMDVIALFVHVDDGLKGFDDHDLFARER